MPKQTRMQALTSACQALLEIIERERTELIECHTVPPDHQMATFTDELALSHLAELDRAIKLAKQALAIKETEPG